MMILTVISRLGEQGLLQHVKKTPLCLVFQDSLLETLCQRQINSRLGLSKDYEYLHYWLKWHLNEHIKPLSRTEQGMSEDLANSSPYKEIV